MKHSTLLRTARRRSLFPLFSLALLGPLLGQAAPSPAPAERWSAPPFEHSVSVRDGRTGARLSWDEMTAELAAAEAVFLGETHIDESTHRVELAVYEALLARRPGEVILAMEMFERDVQEHLDAYLAGEIDEPAFLAAARPWGNYATAYRPMIERAKAAGRPVIASNFPVSLRYLVARGGAKALDTLDDEQARLVPAGLLPNQASYWRRVDNAIRGHIGMMGGPAGEDARLYSTQSLWDNSMGESCAVALEQHPGEMVLHVNGGFHSRYWDGTARQLLLRRPGTRLKTVSIVPAANPALATLEGAPFADYVVFAHALATDLNEGTHSVHVSRELKYRLHVPKSLAPGQRVPLLIWLVDRGLNAEDGLELWRSRLGDSAVIVAIEPPYLAEQDDQSVGGRWYWPDRFDADSGFLQTGIEQVWGYVLRRFPVDPGRVCLAGEGTGATVVSVVTLMTDRMAVEGRAFSPRQFQKIKDLPLPLPEYQRPGWGDHKGLQVYARAEDQDWWKGELGEYQAVGLSNRLHLPTADDWLVGLAQENELRSALGLEPRAAAAGAPRRHVVVGEDSQRGRHWARLLAAEVAAEQGCLVAVFDTAPAASVSEAVPTAIDVADLSTADALPACPGPFGGTTVLVLLGPATAGEPQAWLDLEQDDPLARRNRFLRLRVAQQGGERDLAAVLSELEAAGRKNVLVVPAVFCASADAMRALRKSVRSLEDRMTLHWQAGLGGQLAGR